MMDYEPHYGTSLASTKSPSQMRSRNTFQMELDAKMKQRRHMGLTADLTTEDESDDDGLGSDDELLAGFNMTSKARRPDRPASAKRREDPRAQTTGGAMGVSSWQPPGTRTGVSPRADPKSPVSDDLLAEDILNRKRNPYMKSAPAAKPRGAKGQPDEEEDDRPLTKQEIIFGRKSPKEKDRRSPQLRGNYDDGGKWHPPSFRKTEDFEGEERGLGSPASFGRKTPDHLASISESPKPQPRRRGKYDDLEDSEEDIGTTSGRPQPKPRGTMKEERGRDHKGHEKSTHPKPHQRGTPDIFGTGRKTPNYLLDSDESDDDDMKKKARSKSPGKESEGRKTPVGRKTPTGRQTPTGRLTPGDRKNPTGRLGSPGPSVGRKGRAQSPKGRAQSPSDKADEEEPKKQNVMDFLLAKDKPKEEKDVRKGHRRAESKDSISSEVIRAKRESPLKDILNRHTPPPKERGSPVKEMLAQTNERVTPKHWSRDHTPTLAEDVQSRTQTRGRPSSGHKGLERESSLCRDVDHDPEYQANKAKKKEEERLQKMNTQPPQSKDRQRAGDAIEQVADLNEETSRTMRYIEPDDEEAERSRKSTETQKPKSATKKVRPQARYAKLEIEPGTPKSERSYDSTATIRESIFQDWYAQKMDKSKQELIEKKKKEREEEKKKKEQKAEKETESMLAFKAWGEKKKDYLSNKSLEKRKKEKAEKAKVQEEEEKKTEATLAYRSWKQNKDVSIKERTLKDKQEQRKKEREEARKKEEKLRESKKVQEKWHEKKERVLTAKERQEREAKRDAKEREEEEKRRKEEEAMESYERWMENKERRERRETTRRHASTDSLEERAPWSPAGRTIPFGRA